jgi:hypothetical protein
LDLRVHELRITSNGHIPDASFAERLKQRVARRNARRRSHKRQNKHDSSQVNSSHGDLTFLEGMIPAELPVC